MEVPNYGETIAYWYLRLNGFFPLSRFVLHRHELTIKNSADCDILAVRHPNVYEVVGGRAIDWDLDQFARWGIDLENVTVGLSVEVKTGRGGAEYEERVTNSFSADRITYAIQRIGIWPQDKVAEIQEYLQTAPMYHDPDQPLVFGKLLISAAQPRQDRIPPLLFLSLDQADQFVVERMRSYSRQKNADRHFFPSDLIQYVIWKFSGEE